MWKSRNVAILIVLAVVNFVFSTLVGQLGWLTTGIPGSNLVVFGVIFAIFPSFTLLIFKGKRGLFFVEALLSVIIALSTYVNGAPFDIISRIPAIVSALQCDILFNSSYCFFEKREKLLLWATLGSIEFTFVTQLLGLVVWPLVMTPEAITLWINTLPIIVPVVAAETAIGSYLGYRIYKKVEKID